MKLKIGENIKFLRKTNDITQEGLAEILGVSTQSVSRWELGICYPDMELLPAIATIFKVSVDSLLGVDDATEREEINSYLERFQLEISRGNIEECIKIAREGVAEFPNSYELLNKLMYALFVSGDDTGNIPNWKENMENYDAEILALGERIMKNCPDQDIRLEATARLAFEHIEMGRREIGRAIYETLPSQKYCRENQIWWGLEEDEKLGFLRRKISKDFSSLSSAMRHLASSGKLSDEESVAVLEKALAVADIIWDDKRPVYWSGVWIHYYLGELYARLGNTEKMYQNLRLAADCAKAFDQRPDTRVTSSLLLGEVTEKRVDFDTADTRPMAVEMRDDWLANPVFDPHRSSDKFNEIITLLNAD